MRFTALDSLLDRNIAASAEAGALCRRLDGKTLALHVTGMDVSIFFHAQDGHLRVASTSDAEPAATLNGTPFALIKLAGTTPEHTIRGGSVQIAGDAEVAQAFRDLLHAAKPELEEELARILGDVAAHQIGNAVRGFVSFGRRAAATFAQNVAEFLQEEGRDVPSRTEVEEFTTGVDKAREDADRLEARLVLLEQRWADVTKK